LADRPAWGQDSLAHTAFETARAALERRLAVLPDNHIFLAELGFALAGLGRAEDAARQGLRAVEVRPISRDAVDGPLMATNLARIYTMVGRTDAAIDQLQIVLSKPGPLSPAWLRADPLWAPLRNNPRFERLVAGR